MTHSHRALYSLGLAINQLQLEEWYFSLFQATLTDTSLSQKIFQTVTNIYIPMSIQNDNSNKAVGKSNVKPIFESMLFTV